MTARVSILGCGWLGLPLAQNLINAGFQVKASVTDATRVVELSKSGIEVCQLEVLPDQLVLGDESFFDCDVLITAFPPRRIPEIERVYPAQFDRLKTVIEQYKVAKVMMISSTSVYPEKGQYAHEEDRLIPDKSSGKAVLAAEQILRNSHDFQTTVLRFGGLIGADRNPARFLLRKKSSIAGDKPVNLIHRDDCIGIIRRILEKESWGKIYNGCCPEHPSRKEFYSKAALVSGMPYPSFSNVVEPYKIIDSSKLIRELGYCYKYKSPMDYLDQISDN